MAKKKVTKHDEYVESIMKQSFCSYVDSKIMTVGVYSTNEDMLKANKNPILKKLKNLYKYKIQMGKSVV